MCAGYACVCVRVCVCVCLHTGEPGQRERIAAATSLSQGSLPLQSSVMSHLLDDLNTPGALSELSAPLKGINDLLTTKAGKKQPDR